MNVTDPNRKYRVNEIFHSLQGEGFFTGIAAVFLRMSGCNRKCDFCDTDHSAFTLMTAEEIATAVAKYPSRHLVVTGGEPLLQLDDTLLACIREHGFFIAVETNGTLPVPPDVDWVTCSPKDGPWHINRINELKIVYRQQDVESIASALPDADHLFLQPCSGNNIGETVDYILAHPHWRLSLQSHKLINIK